MIELQKVNKVYEDGSHVLKDIDLLFESGKINVLIGPSGCGKTTTMRLLNRLTEHTEGEIFIDGKNIAEFNPIELRRQMGYVIQSIGLFPHMNIYDNVATVPKLLKWDKNKIDERVTELLEMVNLHPEQYKKRYPSELSGGQQQRVGVIRALAAEPSTILMDEPFSALDPISREQLQNELVRLQKDIQKTIIFVTHDMDEAIKIADQIILMKDGQIVQQGTPQELLMNPANDFVREFIGEDRLANAKPIPLLSSFVDPLVQAIRLSESKESVIKRMLQQKSFTYPVVDETNKLVGQLSLGALLSGDFTCLEEAVDPSVQALSIDQSLDDIFEQLEQQEMQSVPVVDKENTFLGMIDMKNFIQSFRSFYGKRGEI
ncbi:betaine/proline/choline family ABC transporter ATP-binding protein [Sporosarcina cascadiensis]|uniref:betaine/proline/choline family ABC transporter ATP-binding protein n=1 Tax=Sporosarcina cascadiensis TaxID=2660747 RepID=UPI00129A3363|nr:betaine/proline/choline family ABC transporter ATP-binding protein [Sporosarcina cascadiensis]